MLSRRRRETGDGRRETDEARAAPGGRQRPRATPPRRVRPTAHTEYNTGYEKADRRSRCDKTIITSENKTKQFIQMIICRLPDKYYFLTQYLRYLHKETI